MIFFIIAWILLVVFIIFEISKKNASYSKKKDITNKQLLILILMGLYSVIGISTNDPLGELICKWTNVCVPAVVEWVVYVGILGFLAWKFILVDMKDNIGILQKENKDISDRLGKVEGNTEIIKTNIDRIMQKCLNSVNCKKKD